MKRFILIIVILLLFGCSTNVNENEEESKAVTNQSHETEETTEQLSRYTKFHIAEQEDVFGDKTGEKWIGIQIFGESREFGYTHIVIISLSYAKKNKEEGIEIRVRDYPSLSSKLATDTYKIQYKTDSGIKMIAYARPTVSGDSWRITDTRQGQTCAQFLKSLMDYEKIQVYMEGVDYPMNNCKFEIDTENFKTIYDAYFKNK